MWGLGLGPPWGSKPPSPQSSGLRLWVTLSLHPQILVQSPLQGTSGAVLFPSCIGGEDVKEAEGYCCPR